MKKLLAVLLSAAMIFAITGCSKAPVDEEKQSEISSQPQISSAEEQTSSYTRSELILPLPPYTWEELTKKVEPQVNSVKENTIERMSPWWSDSDRVTFDEEQFTDIQLVYDYFEGCLSHDYKYLYIGINKDLIAWKNLNTDTDFIDKVSLLLASLELKEISSEEHGLINNPPINGIVATDSTNRDDVNFRLEGEHNYTRVYFFQNYSSDPLESPFTFRINNRYFIITNFEEIRDEFLEVYAICKGVCVSAMG